MLKPRAINSSFIQLNDLVNSYMKFLINKHTFLKKMVLDQRLEESCAIIFAAKEYYRPLEAEVRIEDNLISIDLSYSLVPTILETHELLKNSIEQVGLIDSIPILVKLLQIDPPNKLIFNDLFNAYEMRGDLKALMDSLIE